MSDIYIYYLTGVLLSIAWLALTPQSLVLPTGRELACLAYAGILCNCVGVIVWFKALKVANATLVGNIAYSAAFLNVLVMHFLVGSPIRIPSLIGLCLIATGVLLASRYATAKNRPPSARLSEPDPS